MSLRARLAIVVVAVVCLLGAPALHAQAITGTIQGSVTDQEGDAVPGVTVTAANTATGYEQTVTSNESGRFSAPLLPLGPYSLTFALDGFATLVRDGLQVSLGQRIFLEVTMQLSTVGEEITVTDEAPLIESTRTEGQTRIDDRSIQGLPNDGRNFIKFTELTPGVTMVQGPDGDELSISGQRGINNNVSVDGADFNNPFFGEQRGGQRPGFTFNQDAIKEMVVIADGAPAEFGRSSGGFVNVVTKSGTNEYNGTAHLFNKSDSLSKCPKTREGRVQDCSFDKTQLGFTFGGPIKKDKLFFFLAADAQEADETKQTDPNRMSPDLITFLNSVGIPDDNGPITRTDDADAYLGKIDWLASDSNLVTLRAAYTYSKQENGTFDVDSWGRSMNGVEIDYSRAITTSVISNVSNNLLNEFRGQYAKEFRPRPYAGPINPDTGNPFPDTRDAFSNEGFGMPFFLPVEYDDDRIQVNNNVSILKGNHSIKAGIEYNEVGSSQTFIGFANGRYVFGGFNEGTGPVFLYLQLVPVNGHTVHSVGTQTITQKEPAIFFQDQWQPTPNLTLELGVRWEQQDQPGPRTPPNEVFFAPFIGQTVTNEFGTFEFPSDGTIPDDDSIQPRFALAYTPDAKSVVRFSAGYYMARLPALMLASSRSTNGSIGGNVRPDQVPNLAPVTWPNIIPESATSGLTELFRPEIFLFDKNFELPKTTSISLSYEREIRPNWALLFKGNYAETDHLFRMFNQNTPFFGCPWSTGLPSPTYGDNGIACNSAAGAEALHTVESTARSEYTGVTVGINKRFSNNYQFQAYYTNSSDRSDDDNERDPFTYKYARADALDSEWGYSDRHQRHRFNAWLSWQAPLGIDVNMRYTYRDAQPLDVNAAGQPIAFKEDRIEAPGNEIPGGYCAFNHTEACRTAPVTQRNLGKKDNKLNVLDIRVAKDFEVGNYTIQPALDVFNVFDKANFLRPETGPLAFNFDGTLRSGGGDPREVQLGVRVLW